MAWTDTYTDEGSFRGVGFLARSSSVSVGRRTVRHDIPGRNAPIFEDIGLSAREFNVEGLLVGVTYDEVRDRLLNALEQPGPGTLVHPWYGEIAVTIPTPATVRETTAEGGMCLVSWRCVRYQPVEVEPVEPDTAEEVVVASDALDSAIADAFDALFDAVDTIEDVRNSIVGTISRATQAINKVRGALDSAMSIVTDTAAAINDLADSAASLILTPVALVGAIQSAVADVVGAVNSISNAVGQVGNLLGAGGVTAGATSTGSLISTQADATDAELSPVSTARTAAGRKAELIMGAARELGASNRALEIIQGAGEPPPSAQVDGTADTGPYIFGDLEPEVPLTTPTRQQEATNQAVFVEMFRAAVTTAVARNIVEVELDDIEQAVEIRDELVAQLEYLAESSTLDDATFGAYKDLRAAVQRHFQRVNIDLPALTDYTPNTSLPALLIAYEIHGDPTRDTELIRRNRIAHPVFVQGGEAIKVQSDD